MQGQPNQPVKLYYNGPMFRYERKQKGRYRQFNQFGVEAIGAENPYRCRSVSNGYAHLSIIRIEALKACY